jgi:hypothetical protein
MDVTRKRWYVPLSTGSSTAWISVFLAVGAFADRVTRFRPAGVAAVSLVVSGISVAEETGSTLGMEVVEMGASSLSWVAIVAFTAGAAASTSGSAGTATPAAGVRAEISVVSSVCWFAPDPTW